MSVSDRVARVAQVIESLEREMELLCVTGVEDKLQDNVRPTLELLRNAGIKIWMLTGDKLETATCIAKSSRLVSRTQGICSKCTVVYLIFVVLIFANKDTTIRITIIIRIY